METAPPLVRLSPLVLAIASMVACAPGARPGFDTSERPPGEDPADGDRGADDGESSAWDPSPPDQVETGTVLVWTINCGMLAGTGNNAWEWTGDHWEGAPWYEVEGAGEDGMPWPQLEPCFRPASNKTMEWDDDGSIRFFNGDWLHDMAPSATEDTWLGTVSPMFEVSQECHEGMAELGLEIPVHLSIRIDGFFEQPAA